MAKPCCDKWTEHAKLDHNASGSFWQDDDGTWNITGCCGGGCFVVDQIAFCPFCGKSVLPLTTPSESVA